MRMFFAWLVSTPVAALVAQHALHSAPTIGRAAGALHTAPTIGRAMGALHTAPTIGRAAGARLVADAASGNDASNVFEDEFQLHHGLQSERVRLGDAHEIIGAEGLWNKPLYVLLFGEGMEEGVYTIRHRSSATCFVLAFEEWEEAARFSMQLEGEGFALPRAESWAAEILAEFCATIGLQLGLVPGGQLITPPSEIEFAEAPSEDEFAELPACEPPRWSDEYPEMVAALERIYSMERSPEIHRKLYHMMSMRRPEIWEDTAVNWPSSWHGYTE